MIQRSVGCAAHQHVGHNRLQLHGAELETRLGIELLDLGDDLEELVHLASHRLAQRREVVPGEQVQVLEKAADDGIVAVLLFQLQSQALRQRAGEHAGRIERLQRGEDLLDHLQRRPELFGDGSEIGARQVARVIDHVDEVLADQALDRILQHERHLRAQVLAERDVVGEIGFDVDVVAGGGSALAQRRPAGIVLPIGGAGRRPVRVDVVVLGIERALGIGHRLVEVDEVGLARRRRLLGLGELGRVGSFQTERRLVALVLFKQRIAFELGLDVLRQLDVRQLQQTDGLLQLWCHHQLLALSELQFCRKRHARVQCLGY